MGCYPNFSWERTLFLGTWILRQVAPLPLYDEAFIA